MKVRPEEELRLRVAAKFPLISISSYEEERVLNAVLGVAVGIKARVFVWSVSRGIVELSLSESGKVLMSEPEPVNDPNSALAWMRDTAGPALFVLLDFHPYLEPAMGGASTVRALRELSGTLKSSPKDKRRTCIFLSPEFKVPSDLRADIVTMRWPLPTRDELRGAAEGLLGAVAPELLSEMPEDPAVRLAEVVKAAEGAQGLTMLEAYNAMALSIVSRKAIVPSEVMAYKKQVVARSGSMRWVEPSGGFETVGGMELLKAWLQMRAKGLSMEAQKYGLDPLKGLLLVGVQGCGKSALAWALGQEWGVPVIAWSPAKSLGKYVGDSEARMAADLEIFETIAPCIVVADEFEKAFAGMGGGGETDGGVGSRRGGLLLTWMQEKKSQVFVYATCNDVTKLPPELLRRGRWDDTFFVDLPSPAERQAIWAVHISKRGRNPKDFDVVPQSSLIEESSGFSGAEIEACVVDGLFRAFSDGGREPTTKDFLEAAHDCVPLSKMASEKIEALRTWAKGRARLASATQGVNANCAEGRFAL